jgi:hypothetical protein
VEKAEPPQARGRNAGSAALRPRFLQWFDGFSSQAGRRNPDIESALTEARWAYHHPVRARIFRLLHRWHDKLARRLFRG